MKLRRGLAIRTMLRLLCLASALVVVNSGCRQAVPAWDGPAMSLPRTQLTHEHLLDDGVLHPLDMSFFAEPDWAEKDALPFSGTLTLYESGMVAPKSRETYPGEDVFPRLEVDFMTVGNDLVPALRGVIDTRPWSTSYWDVALGNGRVWREDGDAGMSRASFPLNLMGRYVGEVRNCVATFVYDESISSNVYIQCSQETAVLDAGQLGDIRAMVPADYQPGHLADAHTVLAAYHRRESRRIPTAPLAGIDDGAIADHFDSTVHTNASTSLGAVYMDGTLYMNPPATRHGAYPYPDEMRHGVFSVTKSMAGAVAMFYFAERYGEEVFEELIVDHVPALARLPEWQGVTFSHALNMVTGVRAGEDLLYHTLELAPDKEAAIFNISRLGDYPEAPGEKFNYATTNTFVLSYAMQNLVEEREGPGIHYWDLVHENVLVPIGATDFRMLYTRDVSPTNRIPILGLGAFPDLDTAAKIAVLIFNEGEHDGRQLLSRNRIREALGRTGWEGHAAFSGLRYSHSFWSRSVRAGGCTVHVTYMEGLGDNRIIFLPSGVITFQFTDEFDDELPRLVRAVEGLRSSCS